MEHEYSTCWRRSVAVSIVRSTDGFVIHNLLKDSEAWRFCLPDEERCRRDLSLLVSSLLDIEGQFRSGFCIDIDPSLCDCHFDRSFGKIEKIHVPLRVFGTIGFG